MKTQFKLFDRGHGRVTLVPPPGSLQPGKSQNFENSALVTGLISLMRRFALAENKGQALILEIGLSNIAVAPESDTGCKVPKARAALSGAADGLNFVLTGYVDGATGTTNTGTVDSGTSTSVFTLETGEGALFQAGSMIRVNDPANGITNQDVMILSKSGDQITLKTTSPHSALTAIPGAGATIEELISEIAIIGDNGANTALGTGVGYARAVLSVLETKPADYGLDVEWQGGFNSP